MNIKFPIVKAGYIFNEFTEKKGSIYLKNDYIEINYPCRLDAMAINPAAVSYNERMVFTPGEVVISIDRFINVKISVINESGGKLVIDNNAKRKVLIKHAYLLMCKALNINPSLKITVDSTNIPKHCGFGSSSSTITAVAVAINELYDNPIERTELIKYLASNHGEEVSDTDDDNIKVVQCIGGGATNGLTEDGIIIIAGKSTTISSMKYEGKVLIGIPNDFVEKDAKLLMELEEENLWKFERTGKLYSEKIAYTMLHKVLPDMKNGSLKELSNLVYNYRFKMGSNENCSFVYDDLDKLGKNLEELYVNNNCEFLSLSSVGPAYFVIVKNKNQEKVCKEKMKLLDLKVIEANVYNKLYEVKNKNQEKCFWQQEETGISFSSKLPSSYITDVIDEINVLNKSCIDIGCGGGRYSKYLKEKGANVLSVDKYSEMIGDVYEKRLCFIQSNMDNIPVKDKSFELALSIGVIHNSESIEEFNNSIKEINRILIKKGTLILSTFTNDIITDDLTKIDDNLYFIKDRPPMILLSKEQINKYVKRNGFNIIKVVDEHKTDVGGGFRNVYTLLLEKK